MAKRTAHVGNIDNGDPRFATEPEETKPEELKVADSAVSGPLDLQVVQSLL